MSEASRTDPGYFCMSESVTDLASVSFRLIRDAACGMAEYSTNRERVQGPFLDWLWGLVACCVISVTRPMPYALVPETVGCDQRTGLSSTLMLYAVSQPMFGQLLYYASSNVPCAIMSTILQGRQVCQPVSISTRTRHVMQNTRTHTTTNSNM